LAVDDPKVAVDDPKVAVAFLKKQRLNPVSYSYAKNVPFTRARRRSAPARLAKAAARTLFAVKEMARGEAKEVVQQG